MIVVAVIGATATITTALVTLWSKQSTPSAVLKHDITPERTPAPGDPTPQSAASPEARRPTPPPPPPGPQLEGVYSLQDQSIGPPLQATMTVTRASRGAFRWQTGYYYLAYPDNAFWGKGDLINQGGMWMLSMHSTNEPGAVPYSIPVQVTFEEDTLTFTLGDGRGMIWQKQ
jgi:hypothetical protein